MARSTEIITKLPLDTWAKIFGLHPVHFNGIDLEQARNPHCSLPWVQHEWQAADRVGIEQVARAIQQAEQNIEQIVNHRLIPSWEVDEVHQTIRPYNPTRHNWNGNDLRGYPSFVTAKWGHFIVGGVRKEETLELGASVDYTDSDADTYEETATVTVLGVDAELDVCQVYVTYPSEPNVRIKPIRTSISGTTLTITFSRNQAVKSELLEKMVWTAIDGLLDDNFISTVDVYREYNDPSTHATLYWEREQESLNGFITSHGDPRLSQISYFAATYNADDESWTRITHCPSYQPDIVRLNYYAGYKDKSLLCPTRDMSKQLEYLVAVYAVSFLDRPVCDCRGFASMIDRWARDLAFSSGVSEDLASYSISEKDLDNPLGTRAGAVYAWRRLLDWRERVTQGVLR